MLKTLLKKEFLEIVALFSMDKKKGKKRSPLLAIGVLLLMLYAVLGMSVMVWELCDMLCSPLVQGGLSWVYFAFVCIYATGLTVLGSVFMAKAKLFEARDNETLLSLPIPPFMILCARMLTLYLLTLACFALVFLPALIKYFTVVGFSIATLACGLVLMLFVPLALLGICSLVGWLIAWLMVRLPWKNLLAVLAFAGFMVGYFWFIGKVNEYLVYVIANGEQVGATIKNTLYPFWQLGLASCGDLSALLMIVLFSVVVFGVIFWILGSTFLSVTTQNRGTKKKKYKAKQSKSVPVILWLVKKEIMRFFKNPMLFLNAGMGTVLSLILGVVAIFNGDLASTLREMTGMQELGSIVAVLACFFATSNIFTAASISLEGECLWILQSTPIKVKEIFLGKIGMHCFFTLIPAYFAAIIVCVMLKISLPITLLVLLLIAVLTVASASVGLAVNLKFPNLHWTNEIAAVKQSVSSLIVMFGGWGASLLVLGGWFLLKKYLSLWVFLSVFILLFAVVGAGMIAWLFGRGKKVFENL